MFLQSCIIRKNTPELIKKLKEIGYEESPYSTDKGDCIVTTCFSKTFTILPMSIALSDDPYINWKRNRIDCNTNDKMFFAIAALNNDNDYNQWFVSDNNQWFLNLYKTFRKDIVEWVCDMNAKDWKKATVSEIVEHFNNK